MSSEIIKVPDIGGSTDVEIIEIAVSEGDVIAPEDTMITLESDKASMDVPAPKGGKVVKILVKEGDTVSEGDDILELEAEGEGGGEAEQEARQESAPTEKSAPADKDQAEDKPAKQASGDQAQAKPAKKSGGGKRTVEIKVPDIGGSENVEIIEVAVAEGDEVNAEDALITLESDKASMDVPSPHSGKIVSLAIKEGDTVSEGDLIGTMEIAGEGGDEDGEPAEDEGRGEKLSETAEPDEPQEGDVEETEGESQRKEIRVPDLGGSENVPIIEMAVAEGDEINEEDPLITLESDKASMDVPSPFKGKLVELAVKEGDTVSEGDLIGYVEVVGAKKAKPRQAEAPKRETAEASKPAAGKGQQVAEVQAPASPSPEAQMASQKPRDGKLAHAGPAVRMLARELGVELAEVTPSGPKGRILKEDVHAFVKQALKQRKDAPAAGATATAGGGIPPLPAL
ncbi:MAG: biotin/lipoyl-containing protein, partial [Halomonas sp.]|nr:biotin/lipoyl-containing protein [Halomonas sp.]